MDLKELRRVDRLPHLSDYTEKSLITELSLYERVLVTTSDIIYVETDEFGATPCIQVSKDVKALHDLCKNEQTLVLPCPKCSEDRPFTQGRGWNPRDKWKKEDKRNYTPFTNINIDQGHHNVFEEQNTPPNPTYFFGNDTIAEVKKKDYPDYPWEIYETECGSICKREILRKCTEIRKDFTCTLKYGHKLFVNFLIFPVVNESLRELDIQKQNKEYEELYDKHFLSLIMIKVGQYPSLRELQLFDTKKYWNILRNNYADYTLALALFANGIGAGAFVYLRRIMESFVERIHQECKNEGDNEQEFDEDQYLGLRFNEKIHYLEQKWDKRIIPKELSGVKNKIYGILSKGVHELAEDDCKNLFPTLKFVIDELIEEQIRENDRKRKMKEATTIISNL